MIVVIGASGFIGTYLVDELMKRNRQAFATTYGNSDMTYFSQNGVPFTQVDMAKPQDIEKLPRENVEAVVLMSSALPVNSDTYTPQHYLSVNSMGVLNVLEYCKQNHIPKIIYGMSHFDVYGLWDTGRAISEEDARTINYADDHAVYIISKITAVNLVEHYRQAYGMQGITFRLPGVYGYGPHSQIFLEGKINIPRFYLFIQNALAGKPIEVWGDQTRGLDFIYVKDVVGGIISALDSDTANGLYNIASGVRTSIGDEARGIVEVFSPPGMRSEIIYRTDKPSIQITYLYDISKARRDFNYEINYPFMKMLADIKLEMERKRFPHLITRQNKTAGM